MPDLYMRDIGRKIQKSLLPLRKFNYASSGSYRRLWEDPYHRNKIVLVVSVLLLMLSYIILTSIVYPQRGAQLSAYSEDWNDVSDFRRALKDEGYEVRSIQSSPSVLKDYFNKDNRFEPDRDDEDYEEEDEDVSEGYRKLVDTLANWKYNEDLSKKLLVILGVERKYGSEESHAIYEFVNQGGKLLIADDFGYANDLISDDFGLTFSGYRLYDKRFEKNPSFVKALAETTDGDFSVMLNIPSSITRADSRNVLLESSDDSFIDTNEDGIENSNEGGRDFDLCVWDKNLGDGSFIAVSDPGLFINDMLDREDNRDFALHLVSLLLPEGGEVIFDESAHISPGYVSSGIQFFLTTIYRAKSNLIYQVILLIIASVLYIAAIIKSRDPQKLFRPRVMRNQASNVRYLKNSLATRKEMQRIFLERVRVEMGLDRERFARLSRKELASILGGGALARFLFDDEYLVDSGHYEKYVVSMENWIYAG